MKVRFKRQEFLE